MMKTTNSTMIPCTMFAVHIKGEDGWRVGTRPVTADIIDETLQKEGKAYQKLVVICEHEAASNLQNYFITEFAGNKGWIYDWHSNLWRGPDESIAFLPGIPPSGVLKINIEDIAYNRIYFSISANERTINVFGDELMSDPLPSFVRLTSNFINGKSGHSEAYYLYGGYFEFHLINMIKNDDVRVITRMVDKDNRESCYWLDVVCTKSQVIKELTNFLSNVREHSDLVHQYFGHRFNNETEWDNAYDLASEAWKRAVDSGEIEKEDYNAEKDLEKKIIRENVKIPDEIKPYINKYLNMLESYKIPCGWA